MRYTFTSDPTGEWDFVLYLNGDEVNKYSMGFSGMTQLVDRLNGSVFRAPGEIEEHVRNERAREEKR